jgi:hypothetical protein
MPSLVGRSLPGVQRLPAASKASTPPTLHGSGRPLLQPPARQVFRRDAIVEATTGPFDGLRDRAVLVALDLENIDRSAHDIGRVVDYGRLACVLRDGVGQQVHLIAVFSCADSETASERFLRARGWATYTRPIDTVRTKMGMVRHGNADVAFATAVGAAVIGLDVEACVLATGDGQLAIDVARCVTAIAPRCKTAATLSLPGSTSNRLDARRSDLFTINLEIGDDVMNRLTATSIVNERRARRAQEVGSRAPASRLAPVTLI